MIAALGAMIAVAGWFILFTSRSHAPPKAPYDFTVKPGASLKSVAKQLSDDGLFPEPHTFWILGRALGKATSIQAGTYRVERPITAVELLDKLARGEVVFVELAFIEGTTYRQWLDMLRASRHVRQTLVAKSPPDILAAIGIEDRSGEGWLFPDTYRFAPGVSDLEILRLAHETMKKHVAQAWAARDPEVPLASPYEALILASIIEKETGVGAERPVIGSVFANRLKRRMRLQTDPTVIYGMGASYDGNIRKKDLTADTPWNTYTRDGLPPTPIAMPGAASLLAAVQPAKTDYLYFVSKGDGSHHFSRTLDEHNQAVARYQLRK